MRPRHRLHLPQVQPGRCGVKKIVSELKDILILIVILGLCPYVVGFAAAKGAMQAGFLPVTINTVNVEDRR